MFRKKLKDMIKNMGIPPESVDDETLDMLQNQLFQLLEHDESLMGGISFKTGGIITNLAVMNYSDIREDLRENIGSGKPPTKLGLKFKMSTMCLQLSPTFTCAITSELCPFRIGNKWWECEIVQSSCKSDLEEWK